VIEPIRVGIVEDHALVREGLRLILDTQPDIEVIGEAADHGGALELVATKRPQVMLVDLTLDGADGLGLIHDMTTGSRGVRVIAVTMHQHEETVRQAFLAGAAGYVVKGAASADLLTAIRAVASNQHYVHPVVASVVVVDSLRWLRKDDRMSLREIQVLRLVSNGSTAAEAGRILGISAHTVRRHLSNMASKIGVRGRIALTKYAVEHHLI
jgi:DNA-binding NarL/FixJ family response regulator